MSGHKGLATQIRPRARHTIDSPDVGLAHKAVTYDVGNAYPVTVQVGTDTSGVGARLAVLAPQTVCGLSVDEACR
jgi:hypothetical protein